MCLLPAVPPYPIPLFRSKKECKRGGSWDYCASLWAGSRDAGRRRLPSARRNEPKSIKISRPPNLNIVADRWRFARTRDYFVEGVCSRERGEREIYRGIIPTVVSRRFNVRIIKPLDRQRNDSYVLIRSCWEGDDIVHQVTHKYLIVQSRG